MVVLEEQVVLLVVMVIVPVRQQLKLKLVKQVIVEHTDLEMLEV